MRAILARLAALLLLAGCAAPPSHLPNLPRPPLAEIVAFAFNGRIAVRRGDERHYAKIDWRHAPARDAVLLTTPLGQGIAEIERDAAGARLTLADSRRYEAADWGALTEQVFGFRLPMQASARWLLGGAQEAEGWRIRVVEREAGVAEALPTAIELEREDIHVRLKIDEWSDLR